jgi:iron-sulfur cluster assembly accessory protein
MSFTLTVNAIKKVKSFYDTDSEIAGKPLRVGVQSGGCAGFSYVFGISDKADDDEVFPQDGFEVVIDKRSMFFLFGSTLDWVESLDGSGFKVDNPQQKGTSCGCGKSVSF